MGSEITGVRGDALSRPVWRLLVAVALLVIAGAAVFVGLVWISLAGCNALADDSTLGMTDKRLAFCGYGGYDGSWGVAFSIYLAATVALPSLLLAGRGQLVAWRGKRGRGLAYSVAVLAPWVVFVIVIGTRGLDALVPRP